jgi:hypothetical protein
MDGMVQLGQRGQLRIGESTFGSMVANVWFFASDVPATPGQGRDQDS